MLVTKFHISTGVYVDSFVRRKRINREREREGGRGEEEKSERKD